MLEVVSVCGDNIIDAFRPGLGDLKWCFISEMNGVTVGRLELPRECYIENGWMII